MLRFDERILLLAAPVFDFFFTCDRVSRIIETLVIHESIDLVGLSEAFYLPTLMLPHSAH